MGGGSQKHTHPEPCRLILVCRVSCTPNPASSLIDTLGRVSSSILSLEKGWSRLLTPTYAGRWSDPDQRIPGMVRAEPCHPSITVGALSYLAASSALIRSLPVTLGPTQRTPYKGFLVILPAHSHCSCLGFPFLTPFNLAPSSSWLGPPGFPDFRQQHPLLQEVLLPGSQPVAYSPVISGFGTFYSSLKQGRYEAHSAREVWRDVESNNSESVY